MENILKFKQYEYRQNSNLVLMADRSSIRRDPNEATGEVESLSGKLAGRMGDRVSYSRPKELEEKLERMRSRAKQNKEKERELLSQKKKDIVSAKQSAASIKIEENAHYHPKTAESRGAYERLLIQLQRVLGDQPSAIVYSFAYEVLSILKNDNLSDADRSRQTKRLLELNDDAIYTEILRSTAAINDYAERDESVQDDSDITSIPVVFSDEEGSDSDDNEFVLKEGDGSDEEYDRKLKPDDHSGDDSGSDEGRHSSSATATLRSRNQSRRNDDEALELKRKRFVADDDGDNSRNEESDRLIDPRDVDSFWLQREIGKFEKDPLKAQNATREVLKILESTMDDSISCENSLVAFLGTEQFDFIKMLLRNQITIVFCTRLGKAQNDGEKSRIHEEMRKQGSVAGEISAVLLGESSRAPFLLDGRRGGTKASTTSVSSSMRESAVAMNDEYDQTNKMIAKRKTLDLESLAFAQGGHFMSNNQCVLPKDSKEFVLKSFKELHIPMSKAPPFDPKEKLLLVEKLPEWARPAFGKVKTLNRVQSRIHHAALEGSENLLLCAPTGSGKTNVAKLCMLHEIGLNRNPLSGHIDLSNFKIVYISPMKSLVREQVGSFSAAFESYGIKVRELSGDINLTKQQIADTQIIVTTPEKWDIVTRKSGDRTFTQLVRLIIIDEIHLLHDDRGPVLETIVARTLRQIEETQEMVRLVGLSATLPNYEDVAAFLRVKPENLFAFDASYRPVPLEQQYVGITERKVTQKIQLMNEILYDKVLQRTGKFQMIIFVHSRKETSKTARMLVEMMQEKGDINKIVDESSLNSNIIKSTIESNSISNQDLVYLLPFGFAIHHAGMNRNDRSLVEDLFLDQRIQILVSTATLAWGVNLPAHTVIVKGTQMYSPEKGTWVELSPMDIMQMLGRAGRIDFDREGEGIVITNQQEIQYYASLMNSQLPVESQMISRLPDALNAEIIMGTIQNVDDAVNWLGYTYLYICMLRSPTLYGIPFEEYEDDKFLVQRRTDLIHSAAVLLDKSNLIKYDRRTGAFQVTNLGRVACHYYLSYSSISIYNEHLKPTMSDIDLFRLFSLSSEFKHVAVRQEEKIELEKLFERIPIPIKESVAEPTAKVNVLLQAYISRLRLEGFALIADMSYVTQSASRILRALFEIVLKRGWAQLTYKLLSLCKMVAFRQWSSQSPLRQFNDISISIIKRLEGIDFPMERLFYLNTYELAVLIDNKALSKSFFTRIHQFPKLDLTATVQPLTTSMLKIELTIAPDFEWSAEIHGSAEGFWILVEDVNRERVLHHEYFILKQKLAADEHYLDFTVALSDPLPPQYFITVVSDRWLSSETTIPVSFRSLILPEKFPPLTELLDLQPVPVSALKEADFEALYRPDFSQFNSILTQVFSSFYESDENCLLSCPNGSGRIIAAELAILRLWQRSRRLKGQSIAGNGKAVYIHPVKAAVQLQFRVWRDKLHKSIGIKTGLLTGETAVDLATLEACDLVIATAEDWDMLSRRWKVRKNVSLISLMVVDGLHLIGSEQGPTLEFTVSRQRHITAMTKNATRFIGLASTVANARDLGGWLGVSTKAIFNFHPENRPVPLEIHMRGFDEVHFEFRMLAMSKPARLSIFQFAANSNTIVFTPSRSQVLRFARDLQLHLDSSENPSQFLQCALEDIQGFIQPLTNRFLKEILCYGVAILHDFMTEIEKSIVEQLFNIGAVRVLIATRDSCWGMSCTSNLVVIMGTQFYDGKTHTYVDYPVVDVLEMMGRSSQRTPDSSCKCVILCHGPKKEFYKKFLFEPLPVESHLDLYFTNHLISEIVTKTLEQGQSVLNFMTWTLLFRRLKENPNYYNLTGVSNRHLSEFLSELVERSLKELEDSQCIAIEGDAKNPQLSALNLGIIASYYNVQPRTIELFSKSTTEKSKLKGILEILTSAFEFEELQIRNGEPGKLSVIATSLPVKLVSSSKFNDAHIKANVLLQAHLCRKPLPTLELIKDQEWVMETSMRLLKALIDVISSNGWLSPTLAAMDLAQLITQALWISDSHLKQLPRFEDKLIEKCEKSGISKVFDILEMDDGDRDKLLQMDSHQLADLAKVCNRYPDVSLTAHVSSNDDDDDDDDDKNDRKPSEIFTGDQVAIVVDLVRENEEEDDARFVHAPFYPKQLVEGWWVLVGDKQKNQLLTIKRVNLQQKASVNLSFNAPDIPGDYEFKVYLVCDAYAGCDREDSIRILVNQGDEGEENEDGEDQGSEPDPDPDREPKLEPPPEHATEMLDN